MYSFFFQELITDLAKYQEMIETTVDMEQANQGEYVIKPDFDETLAGNLIFQKNCDFPLF